MRQIDLGVSLDFRSIAASLVSFMKIVSIMMILKELMLKMLKVILMKIFMMLLMENLTRTGILTEN